MASNFIEVLGVFELTGQDEIEDRVCLINCDSICNIAQWSDDEGLPTMTRVQFIDGSYALVNEDIGHIIERIKNAGCSIG
jgi:hypothetical protein